MNINVVGIDIAKSKFDAALKVKGIFKTKVFLNTHEGFAQFIEWLKRYTMDEVHACMEATGSYSEDLAHYLFEMGYKVSVINPAQIKGFCQSLLTRNKTDRIDAKVISLFGETFNPVGWKPSPWPLRELQALVKRLEALKDIAQQERNRQASAKGEVARSIETIMEACEQEIQRIWHQIREHIDKTPDLKEAYDLLLTIPGLGETTIVKVIAKLGDINRFSHGKQLDAFAGLNPRHYSSGSSVRKKECLSRIGHSDLRKALYFPALVAKRHNPIIKSFCERLEKAGKNKMVIVCAAMRKLLRIIFGVLKTKTSFNPKLAET